MNFNKTAVLFFSCALVLSFVDAGTLKGHVKYDGKPGPGWVMQRDKQAGFK